MTGTLVATELVYILSPSYSGSTLLTLLLGKHPAIATVGELKHRPGDAGREYPCSCGVNLGRCRFWSRLRQVLAENGEALDLRDLGTRFEWRDRRWPDRVLRARVRGAALETLREATVRLVPGCNRHLDRIALRNQRLVEAISGLKGGRIFLDGSKDPTRLHWLVRSGLWNVRAIHLTRDGRGTALSAMLRDGVPMERAATSFHRTHRECRRILSRLDASSWTQLRYEDLCRDPGAVLVRLFAFLGLPEDSPDLDYCATGQHIFGNEMRLRPGNGIRLDERWKKRLAKTDLATFERIAGESNRYLGYP